MFPKGSRLIDVVKSCEGDGYRALKAILFKSHPAFYDQPSRLIAEYPKQRDLSILQYHKLFTDYCQLRAYITDNPSTLDNDYEIDIFINRSKYSEYLNRVTRDERRISSLQYKYKGTQLIETLDKFLLASDSPARSSRTTTLPTYRRGERYEGRRSSNTYRGQSRDNRNYRPSLTSRVHHIAIESDSEEEIVFDDSQDD
eukprot:scaffold14739_cov141-Cylindrotheca_fusiformis.AAC.1